MLMHAIPQKRGIRTSSDDETLCSVPYNFYVTMWLKKSSDLPLAFATWRHVHNSLRHLAFEVGLCFFVDQDIAEIDHPERF